MSNCNYNAGFQNVTDFSSYYLETQLEDNFKNFLDWGFLNIGGFVNVNRPTQNINNSAGFHVLKPQIDPAFGTNNTGKVWETAKKQWVSSSGINYKDSTPISISGIYINNNFVPGPTGTAQYPYQLNYNLGRVVFTNPIPTGSSVQMNYTYKAIQTYKATDTSSNWKELQRYTYLSTENNSDLTSNHRAQMPCIIVEIIPGNNYRPYELGSRTFLASQDILCHVFTENAVDKQNIVDIIKLQKDRSLLLYDLKKVVKDKVYELNPNGSLNNNRINYKNLLDNSVYFWKYASVEEVRSIDNETVQSNLFYNTTRVTIKTVL
jgi:hypothetical protein